ncbi:MAG: signal peptide peptidase SppA [Caulobacteraceae bacterium]|nr:signal peptide peptidase SppA [Caulobacteraceae bacterium]
MKQFLITVAGVFVGLLLFAILVPAALVGLAVAASRPAALPARTVLALDLRNPLTDQEPQGGRALFAPAGQSVIGIETALARAAGDSQVGGLFVRLPDGGISPAAADELRAAFLRFRAAGKPIVAVSQGLYPSGVVTSTYELGAASGDLWMQPGASFQATGVALESVFLKRFFDKYGVQADYQQRYEYKTAVNPYLYSDFTPAHRESELSWMGGVYDTAIASVAADRKLAPATVKALVEAGPYSAEDAKAKGLIDHVGEVKEAENAILREAGQGAKLAPFSTYAARGRASLGSAGAPAIALIQAEGAIITGTSGSSSPFSGGGSIFSDDVAKAFETAAADKDVKAIVFRLSSPGGSDTASEQILAAIRAAKAAGKPVVVSMGTYGASGGYWVSSEASEIVAQPSTLTGSIGVFGGKFAVGDALSRFGVDVRDLSVGGAYADAFNPGAPMNQAQQGAFKAWIDRIYNGFVSRVAQGRRIPVARVGEIAKGRVWTGAQARGLGLVDNLGGLPQAVERAKALARISGEARLKPIPVGAHPLAVLARLLGGADADSARLLTAADDVAGDPDARRLLEILHDARLRASGAMVLAPRLVD